MTPFNNKSESSRDSIILIISLISSFDIISVVFPGKPVFSYGPSNLPINPPDCIILDNWVFDNLISAEKWLQKLYEDLKLVY